MIQVDICGTEQVYDSSLSSWIKEQFHNRRKAGVDFWFIIKIETNGIKLKLPSEGAPQDRGKPISQFNNRERKLGVVRVYMVRVRAVREPPLQVFEYV